MKLTPEQLAADENTSPEELRILSNQSIELAIIIAGNPSADSELLRELSASKYPAICERVTSNPNTPPELLFELCRKFPKQFISNPVFSLLLLENPDLLARMPRNTLIALFDQKELPEFFWLAATKHPDNIVRYIISKHQNTPKLVLEKLAKDPCLLVRLIVTENSDAAQNIGQKLKSSLAKLNKFSGSDPNTHFDLMIAATEIEMNHLGWTKEQGIDYLRKNFGKRSRFVLEYEELLKFWNFLSSIEKF